MAIEVQIVPPSLRNPDCWPASPQQFVNEVIGGSRAVIGDIAPPIMSVTRPSVADQDKLWIKLEATTLLPIGWFTFASGLWLSPHPIVPDSGNAIQMWKGTPDALALKDGGAPGLVTDVSGPFWEIVGELVGRSPMGVGLIPNHTPSKELLLGDTYGDGTRLQTSNEVGTHTHTVSPLTGVSGAGTEFGYQYQKEEDGSSDAATIVTPTSPNVYPGGAQTPTLHVHPIYALYFIKRTARRFLVG